MSDDFQPGYGGDKGLDSRVLGIEYDLRYFKDEIRRDLKSQREYMESKFAQLTNTLITTGYRPPAPELRDPKAWMLVVAGVVGGGIVFIVALSLSLGLFP